MRKRKPSRGRIVARFDKVFSEYVRRKDADHRGYIQCFTCGVVKHWKEVDAGHFQTRAKYSTRWDCDNVKPQCKGCNMTNGGQQYVFGRMLDHHHGDGFADQVVKKSNQMRKWSSSEMEAEILRLRELIREL